MNVPGPPWLDIEQHPEEFYLPISLCIPIKMPDMMTREDLTKLVRQLSSISPESDDDFAFFSKEVIEKNLEARCVNEEEERRAGEEIMPVDLDTGFEESPMLDDMEKFNCVSNHLPGPSPLTGTSPGPTNITPHSPHSPSLDLSLPVPIPTMAHSQIDLDSCSSYANSFPNPSLSIDAMFAPTPFSNLLSLTATTTTNQSPHTSSNSLSAVPTTGISYTYPLSATSTTTHPTTHIPELIALPSSSHQDTTPLTFDNILDSLAGTAAGQDFQSLSNDDLCRYWAQFEAWQGPYEWDPDVTMNDVSEVNHCEGMDLNTSGDSVEQLLS